MRILHFDSVDSTQDVAAEFLTNSVDDLLILADIQFGGRGRLNERTWISMPGNFHGSFIVDIESLGLRENSVILLNTISLKIIQSFIQPKTNQNVTIKFPNDVLIEGLKIAGVLIEIYFPKAIIGIGLNTAIAPLENSTKLDLDNIQFANFFYEKIHENPSTY